MWDLDRIPWELSKIKYIGAFHLPDISLQDPIGTKENHVGSCRNGVQEPVRDLSKPGLPTRTKRADLFIVCCSSATDVQADLQTNCRSSAECL